MIATSFLSWFKIVRISLKNKKELDENSLTFEESPLDDFRLLYDIIQDDDE